MASRAPEFIRQFTQMSAWILLILSAITIGFWIRSYWAMDFFGRMTFIDRVDGPQSITVGLESGLGGIGYCNDFDQFPPGTVFNNSVADWQDWLRPQDGKIRWRVLKQLEYPFWRRPGYSWDRFGFFDARINVAVPPPWQADGSHLRSRNGVFVVVPFWFLLAILGTWPSLFFGARIRRQIQIDQRSRRGLCLNCGYDLRASSKQCPECGAEIGT